MAITHQELTAIAEAVAAGETIKSGAPTVRALETKLKTDIDAADRDRLWEAYQTEPPPVVAVESDALETVEPEPVEAEAAITLEPEPEPARTGYPGPLMWVGPTIRTGIYLPRNRIFAFGGSLPRNVKDFLADRPGLACLLVPVQDQTRVKAEMARSGSDLARAFAEAARL